MIIKINWKDRSAIICPFFYMKKRFYDKKIPKGEVELYMNHIIENIN